jgi:hypothetical protein
VGGTGDVVSPVAEVGWHTTRRDAPSVEACLRPHWKELVPGALLVGAALIFIGLFNSLVLFPWLSQKQATYGVLGVAAGLLFSFSFSSAGPSSSAPR